MNGRLIAAVLISGAFFAACKKKPPENVPVPKADAAVSTAPVVNQNPLTAPGNYLKTTVGQVQKAKDAKALFEESARKNIQSLDLDNTGGE